MIETTILSIEPCGDLSAVEIEVMTEEIFSVDGVRMDPPDRSGDFHQSLHDNRITHSHNYRKTRTTVYVQSPYSADKLAEQIAIIEADIAATTEASFVSKPSDVQERCVINGDSEKLFYRIDGCPQEVLDALTGSFPDVNVATISLISAPSYHEVTGQHVISTFLWEDDAPGLSMNGMRLISRSRKFCLESAKYYDRLYTFVDGTENYDFIPPSCRILAKSVNTNIQDGLQLPSFFDVYFAGDPDVVESAFSLPKRVGAESTYYGVTVVDGKVARVKQYCYDHAGIFFDWDGTVARAAKDHGVLLPGQE